ncbi:MAG: adenylate/guanylate cyclase domain-containing protein [Planctomycetes bacterium]|jgi:class 3 adenylate cyclase|nr:adenylate/guanylate cyclase domain-containing protein [Planctomycetota bacterium]
MKHGDEQAQFEELLHRRGVKAAGGAEVEREILERFQDDVAVMVLDCSGFTRITQKRGIIHFLALWVAMRDLVAPLFDPHQAIGWWGEADNLFAIFPGARFAVGCALAAQKVVFEDNERRAPEDRLNVCIGVGSGKLLRIGKRNAFGDEMNLASKLGEDVAEAGEVLLTERAYEEVKDLVAGRDPEACTVRIGGVDIRYRRICCAVAR